MNDTPALLSKGMARDIVRRVQAKRKDLNLEIEATIDLEVWLTNAPKCSRRRGLGGHRNPSCWLYFSPRRRRSL